MTARTHDLAAISTLAIVFATISIPSINLSTIVVAALANLIGGIAPDIDQPTAPFWRNLPVGKYVGKVFDKLLGGHRFISHSLIGVILFGVLVHLFLQFIDPIIPSINIGYVWWAFIIGFMSHIVMDALTKEGVPLLLPVPHKFGFPPLKAWRLTTGKWVETWVVFPLILIIDCWLMIRFSSHLIYLIHNKIV